MTTDAVGGVWTYSLTLSRELTRRGVRVTLAALGPEPTPDQLRQAGEADVGCMVLGGALDWTAASSGEIDLAGMRLAALTARLRPDVVHLNSPALGANARFPTPVVVGCHSCVKTWWTAVHGEAPLPDDLAWRAPPYQPHLPKPSKRSSLQPAAFGTPARMWRPWTAPPAAWRDQSRRSPLWPQARLRGLSAIVSRSTTFSRLALSMKLR